MSSYIDYLDSISPRWLNKPNGKKFKKAFGQESDLLTQDLITGVNLGRLDLCDESALELHRRNSNLLQSPFESPEQLRTYLKKRWETWSLSGSKLAITNDLKRIGYPNTKVIDWYDLIKLGVSGPTAPFGGTYKKIAGASVNGDIYYLSRVQKNDYNLIEVKHIAAPSQMFSLQLNAEVVEVRLACDPLGNVVSKAKDVVNAINNNSIISKLLFARYSGTGNDVVGLGPGSGVEFEVSFPFWSFFYVTLDAPNGFSEPHFWNGAGIFDYFYYGYKTPARYSWKPTGLTIIPGALEMVTKTFGWVADGAPFGIKVYEWDGAATTTLRLSIPAGDTVTTIVANGINSAWLGTQLGRVYHWDGVSWTLIFTHPMGFPIKHFYITSNALEEGSFFHSSIDLYKWDGAAWNLDVTPFTIPPAKVDVKFSGLSDTNIWMVADRTSINPIEIAHFNGTTWTLLTPGVDYPSVVKGNNFGSVIKMTDLGDGWIAVNGNQDLLRYNGRKWEYYNFYYPDYPKITFYGILALSKNDVWFDCGTQINQPSRLPFRYDGNIFYRVQEQPFYPDLDLDFSIYSFINGRVFALFPDGEHFSIPERLPALYSYALKRDNVAPYLYDRNTIYAGAPSMTGCVWNGDCYWDITMPYPTALLDISRVIKKWKPATTSCRFIQVRVGDRWYSFPVHEDWELDGNGNSKEDFYNKTYLYVR